MLNKLVVENCALLGCYEACSGNSLPTFRDEVSVPFLRFKKISGPIGCPETSVRNYYYTLRKSPEERSSQLLRGGNLKSCKLLFVVDRIDLTAVFM
jgi:hypothetical protein